MSTVRLLHGDSREVLKGLDENSIDAIICDPPYMISFMGKAFDHADGNIAADPEFWAEALRVTKPGGYVAAFGATRTYHRLACAIEDAGWEIRDSLHYMYATGFPKSYNIAKGIEGVLTQGTASWNDFHKLNGDLGEAGGTANGLVRMAADQGIRPEVYESHGTLTLEPTTDEAKQYADWGSAWKPAHEPIVIARKPLSEKNLALNVLKWGTGGINIGAGRVKLNGEDTSKIVSRGANPDCVYAPGKDSHGHSKPEYNTEGRWPPNVLLSPEAAAELDKQSGVSKSAGGPIHAAARPRSASFGAETAKITFGHEDSGGASRFFPVLDYGEADTEGWPEGVTPFFYTAKASQRERNAGCEGLRQVDAAEMTGRVAGSPGLVMVGGKANAYAGTTGNPRGNHHPTLKPVSVLSWLVKLLCPPGGTVLDPFMGSGSTGVSCVNAGFDFIGIERESDYYEIAQARLKHSECRTGLFADDDNANDDAPTGAEGARE